MVPIPDTFDLNGNQETYPGGKLPWQQMLDVLDLRTNLRIDNVKTIFSALQCRLDCKPGYLSDLPPIISCVDGNYEPYRPQEFTCQRTVALIVSTKGEMEVFSEDERCNMMFKNIPALTLTGHSVNLLDNQLILGAFGVARDSWKYLSLKDPRNGLLANPWTETKTLGTNGPIGHLSFVYGKDLFYIGGERGTQAVLQNGRTENGEWNTLKLTWKDGTNFEAPRGACLVKVNSYKFALLGGHYNTVSQKTAVVVMINMREQSVEELGSLEFARTNHACAITSGPSNSSNSNDMVLVTGGILDESDVHDEIFDLLDRSSNRSDTDMNIPRSGHRMVTLGQDVFAFGGQNLIDGSEVNTTEVYNSSSKSWSTHPTHLMTNSTSGLAVTTLPLSAVSCNHGCSCGVKSSARIIGGVEAEVSSCHFFVRSIV